MYICRHMREGDGVVEENREVEREMKKIDCEQCMLTVEVGGENRRPLEEEKSPAAARREIDGRWRRWMPGSRRL